MKIDKYTVAIILICGIAFFIPVWPFFVPYPAVALLVLIFTLPKWKERLKLSKEKRTFTIIFILPWILYALGMFWSKNITFGLEDILLKITMLLFPLAFVLLPPEVLNKKNLNKICWTFVLGVFIISAGCLIRATNLYLETGNLNNFFYTQLSWHYHASYFSMFLGFSIAFLLVYLFKSKQNNKLWKNTGSILLILFFQLVIVLLESKAGWIGLIMVYIVFFGYRILMQKRPISSIIFLLISIFIFWATISTIPTSSNRIKTATKVIANSSEISTEPNSSTAVRLQVWSASLTLISDHFLFGVGTGDVKDELKVYYKKADLDHAVKYKLNSHNQYLQTFAAIGVVGIISLLLCFTLPAFRSVKRENLLYTLFLLLFFMNMLFESMLERQSGVYFYVLFNSIFFYTSYYSDLKIPKKNL